MNYDALSNLPELLRAIVLIALLIYGIAFLYFSYDILKNEYLNDIQRFMWIFVVTTIPIVGIIFYLFIAPGRPASNFTDFKGSKREYSELEKIRRENGLE